MKNPKSVTTSPENQTILGINITRFLWVGMIAAGLFFTGYAAAAEVAQGATTGANSGDKSAGHPGSIGLRLRMDVKDGLLTVVSILPDTPAARAKLQPGDVIVEINGEKTKTMTLEEAVNKVRGEVGTRVNIKSVRPPKQRVVAHNIQRVDLGNNADTPAAPVIQQAYVPPVPATPEELRQKEASQREAEIANAKAAAARDPLNWRVFNELGTGYYKQGMYDQAIAAFQQALALHPITNVIEAERKQEDAIAAQQAAQEAQRQAAIQQAKDQADKQQMGDMLSLIGGIASMKGNMGAQLAVNTMTTVNQSLNSSAAAEVPAITSAEKAESSLKDKREVASIYANLGVAYFGKKSYPQAVAAFDNVTQLDPSRMEVLKVSAEAQYNLCQYEDCITSLTRYHAIAPVESATLLLLSDAYRALGMGPEADKAFGAFLGRHKISSTDSIELLKVGSLCLSHYRYAEAAEYLARAQQTAIGSPESARKLNESQLSLMLAAAQFGQSHTTNAILLLGEATGNNASPKAWYMIGRCYDEIGNREKASEAYRKALETIGMTTPLASADNYLQVCRAATGAGDEAIEMLKNRLASVP